MMIFSNDSAELTTQQPFQCHCTMGASAEFPSEIEARETERDAAAPHGSVSKRGPPRRYLQTRVAERHTCPMRWGTKHHNKC
jgi:hypothetical protein